VGLQAAVAAIHDLLPKLEEDLKALKEAYATKQKQTATKGKQT
jgi:hypothetical protein